MSGRWIVVTDFIIMIVVTLQIMVILQLNHRIWDSFKLI